MVRVREQVKVYRISEGCLWFEAKTVALLSVSSVSQLVVVIMFVYVRRTIDDVLMVGKGLHNGGRAVNLYSSRTTRMHSSRSIRRVARNSGRRLELGCRPVCECARD